MPTYEEHRAFWSDVPSESLDNALLSAWYDFLIYDRGAETLLALQDIKRERGETEDLIRIEQEALAAVKPTLAYQMHELKRAVSDLFEIVIAEKGAEWKRLIGRITIGKVKKG